MNEELRIQVAKCLGWTQVHLATHEDLIVNPTLNGALDRPVGVPPWYKGKNLVENMDPLPRFELDLNACHSFERDLRENDGDLAYEAYTKELIQLDHSHTTALAKAAFASAEQRCLALLKIKGEKRMRPNPNEAPEGYVAVLSPRGSCDHCVFRDTMKCDDAPCLPEDREDKCEVYFVEKTHDLP